jgi:uncharacterized protein (DUF58 family)
VIAAMWYAGASQSNGAAYLLCFVLGAIVLVSGLHAWSNLRGIDLKSGLIPPVFAGEKLTAQVSVASRQGRGNHGLQIRAGAIGGEPVTLAEIPLGESAIIPLTVIAEARGVFPTLALRVESSYPLGFFTAYREVLLAQRHFVYPRPAGSRPLPLSSAAAARTGAGQRAEGEDFGGVRAWRVGESQRHIDWKAAARGQPLLVKQWFGEADQPLILQWDDLPDLEVEARLSQLTRWIVQAHGRGLAFGLRVPGVDLAASAGDVHFHACLRILAQYSGADAREKS